LGWHILDVGRRLVKRELEYSLKNIAEDEKCT